MPNTHMYLQCFINRHKEIFGSKGFSVIHFDENYTLLVSKRNIYTRLNALCRFVYEISFVLFVICLYFVNSCFVLVPFINTVYLKCLYTTKMYIFQVRKSQPSNIFKIFRYIFIEFLILDYIFRHICNSLFSLFQM